MTDKFQGFSEGLSSPPSHLFEATPDDATDLAQFSRGLNVAGAGAVRVTTVGGDTGTIFLAAGVVFPVRVSRIWATGTTATGITVLY